MRISTQELFTPEASEIIRARIARNDYQEVAFVGRIDRKGLVCDVEAIAYGNENSAPVILMDTLQGDVLIHNHPGELSDPDLLRASEADIGVATELANRRIGFYIVDNGCAEANVIYRPEPRVYLDENDVADIFDSDGLLASQIPGYEPRAEQIELVRGMTRTINDSGLLVSEAGTGTGKSLAYLVPAALWAVLNKKRVIISTHTITLQQQILHKDMPLAARLVQAKTGKELHYSLLIGRGNYLCKKRLYDCLKDKDRQATLFAEEADQNMLSVLEEWQRNAQEGTLVEFSGDVKGEIWEEVCCDPMDCPRRKCPFYGDCFYYKARLTAEKSNVIIANHSLVCSSIDKDTRRSSLPFFAGVVFDEAHHTEDVALKSLSEDFSIQALQYHARKLYHERGGRELGMLAYLSRRVQFKGYIEADQDYETLKEIVRGLLRDLTAFLSDAGAVLEPWTRETGTVGLNDDFSKSGDYQFILGELTRIFKTVNRLAASYELFSVFIRSLSSSRETVELLSFITYRIQVLTGFEKTFKQVFHSPPDIRFVKWIEKTRRNIRFSYSPLEIGDFLASSLFSRKDFTLFTSATLMTGGRFDHFKNALGMQISNEKTVLELELPSPYDYRRQAALLVLEEEVEDGAVKESDKSALVRELIMTAEGGSLVLFTSYQRLQEVFTAVSRDLAEAGIRAVKQGDAPRHELLKIMKGSGNVALFATSSFWEGIDIQGHHLRLVIIDKLPFDSPADPVFKAKVDLLESRGINPFVSYAIPRAVLRLKQGFGRLIRSRSDTGLVAILDFRLLTQRYGPVFINSLPPIPLIAGSPRQLVIQTENFFIRSSPSLLEK